MVPLIQGPITRRPGSRFVSEVKTSSKVTRLIPFRFSTTQAYQLEFGDQYIRFYKNNAPITLTAQNITGITKANPAVVTYSGADTYANGDRVLLAGVGGMVEVNNREFTVANVDTVANTFELSGINSSSYATYTSGGTVSEIYEISTPYLEADLRRIKYTQSADVIYLAHPSYAPRKLSRTGHTSWTLTTIDFQDGPYLPVNTTSVTLTPSTTATGPGCDITASSATFSSSDVGRWIRINTSGAWGACKITSFTSSTLVTTNAVKAFAGLAASTEWRMGIWSDTTGYPAAVAFHEDRLFYGGATQAPQRFDGSCSGDYENFAPSATAGTVAANNAVSFTLNADDVSNIRWFSSDEKGLLCGTVGGEWVIRPSSQGEAISPTNISAKRATTEGSADTQPIRIGKATIFIQEALRKIHELVYFYEVDGFNAPDLTEIAEHIAQTGIIEMAYQKQPQSIIWACRTDGLLVGCTYRRNSDGLSAGWHRHVIGGTSNAVGDNAAVESVSVIPSADGSRQELWMIVKRYINGSTKRYVEYIGQYFDDEVDQQDAFFVDSGLTYDSPVTVSGATQANPVVITANSHGYSNGDKVLFNEVGGMEDLNGNTYKVANAAANTFELQTLAGANVNGTSFAAYVSGGEVRKLVSTVTGLWHLNGETVDIVGDGKVQTSAVVSSGSVSLATPAAVVHIGKNIDARGKRLKDEAGSANGASYGKVKRSNEAIFDFYRTNYFAFGLNFDDMNETTFRNAGDAMDRATPLYSGFKKETLGANYDRDNQICWRINKPLPCTLRAILPQLETMDR